MYMFLRLCFAILLRCASHTFAADSIVTGWMRETNRSIASAADASEQNVSIHCSRLVYEYQRYITYTEYRRVCWRKYEKNNYNLIMNNIIFILYNKSLILFLRYGRNLLMLIAKAIA